LDDTFGFDGNENTKSGELFENLYAGTLEEDAGTNQSSSVELNPYTANDAGAKTKQEARMKPNKSSLDRHREAENKSMQQGREDANRPRPRQQQRQEMDSIFRSHSKPSQITPRSGTTNQLVTSYEKKISENMQLISPTMAMDRRRSRPRLQAQQPVVSPNSSMFTSATPPILRTSTGTSLRRNDTGSSTSRSRNRHRSRSRGTPRGTSRSRRSRSRSTSIAPSTTSKKGDAYHSNLFRGAALIREQLLRSMASTDQAMDEAEREFMEEMIEHGRGGHLQQQQQLHQRGTRQAIGERGEVDHADNEDIDFDYSFDHDEAGDVPSPSRSSCVRFAASQDSGASALETESRRLDNLMSIFVATSSTSSNSGGNGMSRSSSDKENEARPSQPSEVNASCVISPTSSLGLGSPMSQLQNGRARKEYAGRYFQDDAPKPIAAKVQVEAVPEPIAFKPRTEVAPKPSVSKLSADPILTKNDNARPKQSGQNQPTGEPVDEALAHARRAGPIWRSLVGNHVRFPSKWDAILPSTSPEVHNLRLKWSKWYYVARHRVKGDRRLNSREFGVRSRRSGGRILMRMLIREMHSQQPCREIVIGCFHPNSKGIRKGDPLPGAEDVREVWMSVRWVMESDKNEPTPDLRAEVNNYEGVIDNYLMQKKKTLDYVMMGSALGHRKAVNNENVRAIFGDQSPMTTVDLHEDEVADIIKANVAKKLASLPALMLLKLFLFSK